MRKQGDFPVGAHRCTIATDGKISWSLSDGTNFSLSRSTTVMSSSVTNHIALKISGNSCAVSVGGVEEGAATLPGSRVTSTAAMTIGRASLTSSAVRYLVGWIDQVRIYNRALSQAEIAALAAEV